jgi:hypothetical protein
MHESETIRDPFPEHPFGGVLQSRGERDEQRHIPDVEILTDYHGQALCSRCGREALPPGGAVHDLLFDVDAAGIHRPVCKDCRRDGEQLTGWPGPRVEMVAVPPGYSGEKPLPPVKPFPDIPMVRNAPSLWSPIQAPVKRGVSKYRR